MQEVWARHGKTELPYVIPDLEQILGSLTGDAAFAKAFFAKYVYGNDSFNYAPMLQKAGMSLKRQFAGQAWLGDVRWKDESLVISANTLIGTPIYEAGLDIDDQILKLDGQNVNSASALDEILKKHKPGDQLPVEYAHREDVKMSFVTLAENPKFIVELNEKSGVAVTAEMLEFRRLWLESKVVGAK